MLVYARVTTAVPLFALLKAAYNPRKLEAIQTSRLVEEIAAI